MISLEDLLAATGAHLHGVAHAHEFTDLAFDSRRLAELPRSRGSGGSAVGPLFVAVKTATGDGHDYAAEAVHRGAAGVLCERIPTDLPDDVTCVLVADARQALLDWAQFVLLKYGTQVVAVTGSSGKTTTKEAIAAVLETRFAVFRSQGTFSGRYGLPIALGKLRASHEVAVLELAADSVDEIRDLAEVTRPHIGVVTSINEAHIYSLGSMDAIEKEKGRLVEALPDAGVAVLNRDDPRVWRMRERTTVRAIGYGFAADADWTAANVQCGEDGLCFDAFPPGYSLAAEQSHARHRVSLRLLGRHHVYAALAALAVGHLHNIPIDAMVSALAELSPLPGRLCPISGASGTLLLDDSYDAQSACVLAALETLRDHFADHRRIAVLGALRGGGDARLAYQRIGERAAEVADVLVLKGEETEAIRRAALSKGMDPQRIFETFTSLEAVRYLSAAVQPGDVILVKGAREDRMEDVTRGLMRDPSRALAMLVRQEDAYRHVHLALPQRPTWLEVDLEAIASNLRQAQAIVGDSVDVMAVLKADGYGHGAVRIARTALNNGARMLGVACLSEGVVLRRAGILAPILVLGYTPAWQARKAVLHNITSTVFDIETARAFSRAASQVGRSARVHLKVDTGMGRLGVLLDGALDLLRQISELPSVVLDGVFTHFSVADATDKGYTCWQLERFRALLDQVRATGISVRVIHAANSAAMLTVPESRFNMVRLGIALYGLSPSSETPLPAGFRPALSFKTRIAQVKTLPPGSFVSYGNTYRTAGSERIAVIPVGYADGFRRAPSHWGDVLVRGQRAPIVGRVCMDQTMVNVSHIPGARQGDEVVLIGQQGGEALTVDEIAEQLGTINYEVVSEILARVPRVS